ncbi:MAG: glutamate--tRNA ligase [Candidatus Bathyarchaeota archaeon]|nr:MAG: glutamate--tRNA ligase [Candidatus Bathyarchaeota archaeon]
MEGDEIRGTALKHAVHNAATHEGRAQVGPVMGRIMAEHPELRQRVAEVKDIIQLVVAEVNSWSLERQREMLSKRWPELLESAKRREEKKDLPPLENVDRFEEIRTRFAPNPDGALHLGSAEPIVFCDEYARVYDGKFVLRYEDTSPNVKAPILEVYDWIREDIEWLGARVDEVYIQSERLEIYYDHAVKLISLGAAYICTCDPMGFKELYMAKEACPCRDQPAEVHTERWSRMLDGTYEKGEAVLRIKTDLNHPNPAVRDWPAMRIATGTHPRQGNKYRVWPLYNFSCAIEDPEMKISHIIRGKEHEVNTTRQRFLARHLGWEFPEIINIGRLGLEVGVLSKSKIRKGIEDGVYSGWDDPRLGTLRSLRRRGLQPEAIREIMIQVGPKPINATLSWDHIASVNRRIIEPKADRYFFVDDPVALQVEGAEKSHEARLPLHPDYPERGTREYTVRPEDDRASLIVSQGDASGLIKGSLVRLMGLLNVEVTAKTSGQVEARYHSKDHLEARRAEAPFIHWLPEGVGVEARVVMPDASVKQGLAEPGCVGLTAGEMIQFERFGFVRVDSADPFVAYYAHR